MSILDLLVIISCVSVIILGVTIIIDDAIEWLDSSLRTSDDRLE